MIIARIESFIAGKGLDDAMERALAYIEAGADGIMIHSKHKSGADIKEFCAALRKGKQVYTYCGCTYYLQSYNRR